MKFWQEFLRMYFNDQGRLEEVTEEEETREEEDGEEEEGAEGEQNDDLYN